MGKTAKAPLKELDVTVMTFFVLERVRASAVWC